MDNNKKEEQIKQIKILFIVLLIIIGIAIFVNISKGNNNKEMKNETENNIDMSQVVIDGITESELESMSSFMDDKKYEEYRDTFEKIRKGELQYEEGMSLEVEDEKLTEEEIDEQNKKLDEQLSNSSWHYYVSEDGTVTNTIVYDDIDFHDSEE